MKTGNQRTNITSFRILQSVFKLKDLFNILNVESLIKNYVRKIILRISKLSLELKNKPINIKFIQNSLIFQQIISLFRC